MSQGGWHPDPWGQAEQRWWDGTQWTEHTHGAAAAQQPAPAAQPAGRRRGPVIALIAGAAVFLVMLLALIVFFVSGAGGGGTFEEPDFNISFEYPSGLERQDVPDGNADAKVSLVIDQKNGVAVSKYEQETAVTESNIGLTKTVLDGVVGQLAAGPAPEGKRVTIAGLPGYEYDFAIESIPGTRSRSIFLFQGRDEYQINCQFQPSQRDKIDEACDQALETLKTTGSGR